MVDDCVTTGVVVLGEGGGGMTIVEVVVDEGGGVDDGLAKRVVEVEVDEEVIEIDVEEGGGRVMVPEVEEGVVVVTTWMVEEEVIEVDVEAKGGARVMEPKVEEGAVVVTTWMVEEACCCSTVVIRLERPERDAWRESRVTFMEVMREKRVEESATASWASTCLPVSSRRRLSTDCVSREVMLMLDSTAITKETVGVVAVDGEAGGDEVEAAVVAVAAAAR
ncbi:hypothetical protein CBR_g53506 [Chara braunii]|uniref:Uncharacterized protein n=1 Tax=Chara braunii TaxID=69332 RepID=A0A388MB50_CHABU|nr:hypothetical protein CBR_g53506 [Chara braunii]|eukprot:GBG91692.1 hypothetical protein CBR_g53506 [Chara braunii]